MVVLANRSTRPLVIALFRAGEQPTSERIDRGAVLPVFTSGKMEIEFATGKGTKRYVLDANCAYFFGDLPDRTVDMQKIGLGGTAATALGRPLEGDLLEPGILTVKIVVDEEEPLQPRVWERKLRKRIAQASDVLQRHCMVQLEVLAVEVWDSDDSVSDFYRSLTEFEREVDPAPAQVAIAFTSQYDVPPPGRTHLGGTRGPMSSHILIREWSQHVGEPERLELLIHECGHFLGAAHSPEQDSVMRPILGDRQALRAGFQIKFDPVNTLIMCLVGEEIRRAGVRKFSDMSTATQRRLQQVYSALNLADGNDPATPRFLQLLKTSSPTGMAESARRVLDAIVRAAHENVKQATAAGPLRRGDELFEHYVKSAAFEALRIEADEQERAKAFLFAIGIGLDDSPTLLNNPASRGFVNRVETSGRRSVRLGMLGKPTIRGRRDLAQHFALSAYLTVAVGPAAAEQVGISKEILDSNRESGFSFADYAADKAGIAFAQAVLDRSLPLKRIAVSFRVDDFMPGIADLPEGLSRQEFVADYGHPGDERFAVIKDKLEAAIRNLPGYQN